MGTTITRRAKLTMALGAVAALAALLAGCSGGGRDMSAQVTTAGTFLGDQATIAAMNIQWFTVLFPSVMHAAGSGSPEDIEFTTNPDGSIHWVFRDSDGTVETWDISADGSSQTGVINLPGGGVTHSTLVIEQLPGPIGRTTEDDTNSDGSRLHRVSLSTPVPPGDPDPVQNSQTGALTLADGRAMDFTMTQHLLDDELTVNGHEGWSYQLNLPTQSAEELPDTLKAGVGSLTRGTTVTSFTFAANPGGQQWLAMSLTAPGGIAGTYQLDPAMTGRGTVKQSGQLLMTAQWGSTGAVTATLADGLSQVGQPSAAARDFLIDKWLWDLSAFGPNPR
jgi:hypothetical protein